MNSIIEFSQNLCFNTLWAEDLLKILIIYYMCKGIMMLAKVIISWRI